MSIGYLRELIRIRRQYSDWLLTVLTILIFLMMFVVIPLQATGVAFFQAFGLAELLVIIACALVISINPVALAVLSIAFVTMVLVIALRSYWPLPHGLQIVAGCWLIIALTLAAVVARAVFRRGRVTYHRLMGAVLLYLLIALAFVMLYAFVGLSFANAFSGLTFEFDPALGSRLLYFSFITLTSTGYGDIAPIHPLARSLCSLEAVIGQLYPAILLARLVTLELLPQQTERPK